MTIARVTTCPSAERAYRTGMHAPLPTKATRPPVPTRMARHQRSLARLTVHPPLPACPQNTRCPQSVNATATHRRACSERFATEVSTGATNRSSRLKRQRWPSVEALFRPPRATCARITTEVLRRSLEITPGISCEARLSEDGPPLARQAGPPTRQSPRFVSFMPLFRPRLHCCSPCDGRFAARRFWRTYTNTRRCSGLARR